MASFGLSPFTQAIVSSILLTGVLVLYLRRFAGSRWWPALALGVCAIDQAVKVCVLPALRGHHVGLLHGALGFVYLENREQGFGGEMAHLLLATLLCVCALLVLYDRLTKANYHMSAMAQAGFALVIGGYLGILVDRIRLGFVMDFIELGKAGDFVYNIADLAVLAAVALLTARGLKYLTEAAIRRQGLLSEVSCENRPREVGSERRA